MSVRKSRSIVITFPAVDTSNRPNRKSGLSWSAADLQVSKDAGTFNNSTNLPAELGTTGRYKLQLTGAEMSADWVHVKVSKSGIDDVDIMLSTTGNPAGSVVADGSNTNLSFKTNLTEAADDYWKDALITFTNSSTLLGQVKKIVAYNGTTKVITVGWNGFTSTPTTGDLFILVEV